jgi:hypothetical protein
LQLREHLLGFRLRDLDAGELRLRRMKNGGEDVTYVPPATVAVLREYLGDRTQGPLFPVPAPEFELAVLIVAHFVKNPDKTVEQAIGGAGTIQNMAKGIFVVGPEPESVVHARLGRMLGHDQPAGCAERRAAIRAVERPGGDLGADAFELAADALQALAVIVGGLLEIVGGAVVDGEDFRL